MAERLRCLLFVGEASCQVMFGESFLLVKSWDGVSSSLWSRLGSGDSDRSDWWGRLVGSGAVCLVIFFFIIVGIVRRSVGSGTDVFRVV